MIRKKPQTEVVKRDYDGVKVEVTTRWKPDHVIRVDFPDVGERTWRTSETVVTMGGAYVDDIPMRTDVRVHQNRKDEAEAIRLAEEAFKEFYRRFVCDWYGCGDDRA